MRTEVATIQQMLTPEAAAVLTRSIEEAGRRRHGQTTPLHVAANLLAAPSGLLRRACAVSHPLLSSSSHPLHCRALELCFSVALDRLPTGATPDGSDADPSPPLSNALVAAVKRAQAHQRRGCADQQQPVLLAVKVELGQLVVSILDDPSVSRVMREAGFSSPAVKAAIEQALSSSSNPAAAATSPSSSTTRNVYISPRLQQDAKRKEEIKKVFEIMTRPRKRNPVLVGDSDAVYAMKQMLTMIEKEELGMETPAMLRLAQVVSLEKEFMSCDRSLIPTKINELYSVLEPKIRALSINSGIGGLVLDLGDLKWIVESAGGYGGSSVQQQQQQIGRAAVREMGRLLARLQEGDGNGSRVWVVGTATCATYLRCQVYHPMMESEWDIQALPVAPRSPPPLAGLFPRAVCNGSTGSLIMAAASPPQLSQGSDSAAAVLSRAPETALCSLCTEGYLTELDKLETEEPEGNSSEPGEDSKATLPQWLQIAVHCKKPAADRPQQKEKVEELLQKWRGKCSRLHMNSHVTFNASERCSRVNLPQQFSGSISLNQNGCSHNLNLNSSEHQSSKVKTDLVLGLSQPTKDSFNCSFGQVDDQKSNTIAGISDTDSTKRLLKGLTETVSWQPEAASVIAAAVMRCKSGRGKPRGSGAKADLWLLFSGPDKVGKMKMAAALSELMFNTAPTRINLGSPSTDDGELDAGFRGRTLVDRIAEAIQQNPFSVIVLEDIDHADGLVRGTITRAIGSGRLVDSHGREVLLSSSSIFILMSDWWPDNVQCEDKMLDSANSGWQLELSFSEKSAKRRPDWLLKEEQPMKQRKQSSSHGLSLDLNLAVSLDDDAEEGSWNSSDLTVENEHKYGQLAMDCPTSSNASELIDMVEEAVVFKPVDFDTLRKRVSDSISSKFARITGIRQSIQIDEEALDRIVGGVWQSGSDNVFDEWTDRVLVPSMNQLRNNLDFNDGSVVRLSSVKTNNGSQKSSCAGNRFPEFPETVSIAIDGA
ncbi:protein SMAX1-like [Canna indica]|uniref:Protein SMAX1-like n=1 Tax=Canna indica TaxID=4628 RepID=A0AAQ3L7H4_9LILI|nr:protein SMAX1-like [Canna indica]